MTAPESPAVCADRVWYLAYGSNVNESRFLRYIRGGKTEPGCRDSAPPARSRWLRADLALRFAGTSKRWGGGVAFVDRSDDETAHVRAWDISFEQFEDVFAQENRLTIPHELPQSVVADHESIVGIGWYRRILRLPQHDTPGQPALTFTSERPLSPNGPTAAYVGTIRAGLATNPELTGPETDAYLAERAIIQ